MIAKEQDGQITHGGSRGARRMDRLVPVPDGLDDPTATSYTNPLTAWALTRSSHNLKEGDWLLQTAAASSVGKLVLQLAQQYRLKTINVIRRREQETIIRNLGGNEVICTADEDLRARLQELTAGKPCVFRGCWPPVPGMLATPGAKRRWFV